MGSNSSNLRNCLLLCAKSSCNRNEKEDKASSSGRNQYYRIKTSDGDDSTIANDRMEEEIEYVGENGIADYKTVSISSIHQSQNISNKDFSVSSSFYIYQSRPSIQSSYIIASFRYKRLCFAYLKEVADLNSTVEYLEDLKYRCVKHIFRFGTSNRISKQLLKLNGITVDDLKCKNGNIPEKNEIQEWLNKIRNYIKSLSFAAGENKRVVINVEDSSEHVGMADLLIGIILMEYDLNYSSALIKMVYHKSISLNLVQMILIERYKSSGLILSEIEILLSDRPGCLSLCHR